MYKVNTKSYDKLKKETILATIIVIIMAIVFAVSIFNTIKKDGFNKEISLFIAIFPLIFVLAIYGSIKNIIDINKKCKDIEYLKNNGKLIKRIPYVLKKSMVKRGDPKGRKLRAIVLHYTLPNGITLTLESEPKDDTFTIPKEGYADLLIDENDPSRYFIDTNIDRISGNKEEDFYKE